MSDLRLIKIDPITREVTIEASPKQISGSELLVQVVVLSLLNIPGKDALEPNKGGGIPSLIGYNIYDEDTIFSDIAERVAKTQEEVLDDQIGLLIDPEEKLKEIVIKEISRGGNEDEILLRLQIINEVGRIAEVVI